MRDPVTTTPLISLPVLPTAHRQKKRQRFAVLEPEGQRATFLTTVSQTPTASSSLTETARLCAAGVTQFYCTPTSTQLTATNFSCPGPRLKQLKEGKEERKKIYVAETIGSAAHNSWGLTTKSLLPHYVLGGPSATASTAHHFKPRVSTGIPSTPSPTRTRRLL